MNRPYCFLCKLVLGTLCAAVMSSGVLVSSASAQDGEAATEFLMKDVGTWDAEVKINMGGTEFTMTGVETNRMVGTFVVSEFAGDMGGAPFVGHAVYGFDEEKNKVVGTWVDNMTGPPTPRHLAIMEGDFDAEAQECVFFMDGYDETGNKVKEKHVAKNDGNGSRSTTMYQQNGDEWVQTITITYKLRPENEQAAPQQERSGR